MSLRAKETREDEETKRSKSTRQMERDEFEPSWTSKTNVLFTLMRNMFPRNGGSVLKTNYLRKRWFNVNGYRGETSLSIFFPFASTSVITTLYLPVCFVVEIRFSIKPDGHGKMVVEKVPQAARAAVLSKVRKLTRRGEAFQIYEKSCNWLGGSFFIPVGCVRVSCRVWCLANTWIYRSSSLKKKEKKKQEL